MDATNSNPHSSIDDLYGDMDSLYSSQTSADIQHSSREEVHDSKDDIDGDEDMTVTSDGNDLDLYGDLITEEGHKEAQTFQEMGRKLEESLKLIGHLEMENQKLRGAVCKHETTSKDLQKNFSSLLLTARGEIGRKEKEINTLRMKLNQPSAHGRNYGKRRAVSPMNSTTSIDTDFEPMCVSSPVNNNHLSKSNSKSKTSAHPPISEPKSKEAESGSSEMSRKQTAQTSPSDRCKERNVKSRERQVRGPCDSSRSRKSTHSKDHTSPTRNRRGREVSPNTSRSRESVRDSSPVRKDSRRYRSERRKSVDSDRSDGQHTRVSNKYKTSTAKSEHRSEGRGKSVDSDNDRLSDDDRKRDSRRHKKSSRKSEHDSRKKKDDECYERRKTADTEYDRRSDDARRRDSDNYKTSSRKTKHRTDDSRNSEDRNMTSDRYCDKRFDEKRRSASHEKTSSKSEHRVTGGGKSEDCDRRSDLHEKSSRIHVTENDGNVTRIKHRQSEFSVDEKLDEHRNDDLKNARDSTTAKLFTDSDKDTIVTDDPDRNLDEKLVAKRIAKGSLITDKEFLDSIKSKVTKSKDPSTSSKDIPNRAETLQSAKGRRTSPKDIKVNHVETVQSASTAPKVTDLRERLKLRKLQAEAVSTQNDNTSKINGKITPPSSEKIKPSSICSVRDRVNSKAINSRPTISYSDCDFTTENKDEQSIVTGNLSTSPLIARTAESSIDARETKDTVSKAAVINTTLTSYSDLNVTNQPSAFEEALVQTSSQLSPSVLSPLKVSPPNMDSYGSNDIDIPEKASLLDVDSIISSNEKLPSKPVKMNVPANPELVKDDIHNEITHDENLTDDNVIDDNIGDDNSTSASDTNMGDDYATGTDINMDSETYQMANIATSRNAAKPDSQNGDCVSVDTEDYTIESSKNSSIEDSPNTTVTRADNYTLEDNQNTSAEVSPDSMESQTGCVVGRRRSARLLSKERSTEKLKTGTEHMETEATSEDDVCEKTEDEAEKVAKKRTPSRRSSSENLKRPILRRVTSETILTITSVEKRDGLTYTFEGGGMTSENVVMTCSETEPNNDEVMNASESANRRLVDKICNRAGCTIKVNHLHPKSPTPPATSTVYPTTEHFPLENTPKPSMKIPMKKMPIKIPNKNIDNAHGESDSEVDSDNDSDASSSTGDSSSYDGSSESHDTDTEPDSDSDDEDVESDHKDKIIELQKQYDKFFENGSVRENCAIDKVECDGQTKIGDFNANTVNQDTEGPQTEEDKMDMNGNDCVDDISKVGKDKQVENDVLQEKIDDSDANVLNGEAEAQREEDMMETSDNAGVKDVLSDVNKLDQKVEGPENNVRPDIAVGGGLNTADQRCNKSDSMLSKWEDKHKILNSKAVKDTRDNLATVGSHESMDVDTNSPVTIVCLAGVSENSNSVLSNAMSPANGNRESVSVKLVASEDTKKLIGMEVTTFASPNKVVRTIASGSGPQLERTPSSEKTAHVQVSDKVPEFLRLTTTHDTEEKQSHLQNIPTMTVGEAQNVRSPVENVHIPATGEVENLNDHTSSVESEGSFGSNIVSERTSSSSSCSSSCDTCSSASSGSSSDSDSFSSSEGTDSESGDSCSSHSSAASDHSSHQGDNKHLAAKKSTINEENITTAISEVLCEGKANRAHMVDTDNMIPAANFVTKGSVAENRIVNPCGKTDNSINHVSINSDTPVDGDSEGVLDLSVNGPNKVELPLDLSNNGSKLNDHKACVSSMKTVSPDTEATGVKRQTLLPSPKKIQQTANVTESEIVKGQELITSSKKLHQPANDAKVESVENQELLATSKVQMKSPKPSLSATSACTNSYGEQNILTDSDGIKPAVIATSPVQQRGLTDNVETHPVIASTPATTPVAARSSSSISSQTSERSPLLLSLLHAVQKDAERKITTAGPSPQKVNSEAQEEADQQKKIEVQTYVHDSTSRPATDEPVTDVIQPNGAVAINGKSKVEHAEATNEIVMETDVNDHADKINYTETKSITPNHQYTSPQNFVVPVIENHQTCSEKTKVNEVTEAQMHSGGSRVLVPSDKSEGMDHQDDCMSKAKGDTDIGETTDDVGVSQEDIFGSTSSLSSASASSSSGSSYSGSDTGSSYSGSDYSGSESDATEGTESDVSNIVTKNSKKVCKTVNVNESDSRKDTVPQAVKQSLATTPSRKAADNKGSESEKQKVGLGKQSADIARDRSNVHKQLMKAAPATTEGNDSLTGPNVETKPSPKQPQHAVVILQTSDKMKRVKVLITPDTTPQKAPVLVTQQAAVPSLKLSSISPHDNANPYMIEDEAPSFLNAETLKQVVHKASTKPDIIEVNMPDKPSARQDANKITEADVLDKQTVKKKGKSQKKLSPVKQTTSKEKQSKGPAKSRSSKSVNNGESKTKTPTKSASSNDVVSISMPTETEGVSKKMAAKASVSDTVSSTQSMSNVSGKKSRSKSGSSNTKSKASVSGSGKSSIESMKDKVSQTWKSVKKKVADKMTKNKTDKSSSSKPPTTTPAQTDKTRHAETTEDKSNSTKPQPSTVKQEKRSESKSNRLGQKASKDNTDTLKDLTDCTGTNSMNLLHNVEMPSDDEGMDDIAGTMEMELTENTADVKVLSESEKEKHTENILRRSPRKPSNSQSKTDRSDSSKGSERSDSKVSLTSPSRSKSRHVGANSSKSETNAQESSKSKSQTKSKKVDTGNNHAGTSVITASELNDEYQHEISLKDKTVESKTKSMTGESNHSKGKDVLHIMKSPVRQSPRKKASVDYCLNRKKDKSSGTGPDAKMAHVTKSLDSVVDRLKTQHVPQNETKQTSKKSEQIDTVPELPCTSDEPESGSVQRAKPKVSVYEKGQFKDTAKELSNKIMKLKAEQIMLKKILSDNEKAQYTNRSNSQASTSKSWSSTESVGLKSNCTNNTEKASFESKLLGYEDHLLSNGSSASSEKDISKMKSKYNKTSLTKQSEALKKFTIPKLKLVKTAGKTSPENVKKLKSASDAHSSRYDRKPNSSGSRSNHGENEAKGSECKKRGSDASKGKSSELKTQKIDTSKHSSKHEKLPSSRNKKTPDKNPSNSEKATKKISKLTFLSSSSSSSESSDSDGSVSSGVVEGCSEEERKKLVKAIFGSSDDSVNTSYKAADTSGSTKTPSGGKERVRTPRSDCKRVSSTEIVKTPRSDAKRVTENKQAKSDEKRTTQSENVKLTPKNDTKRAASSDTVKTSKSTDKRVKEVTLKSPKEKVVGDLQTVVTCDKTKQSCDNDNTKFKTRKSRESDTGKDMVTPAARAITNHDTITMLNLEQDTYTGKPSKCSSSTTPTDTEKQVLIEKERAKRKHPSHHESDTERSKASDNVGISQAAKHARLKSPETSVVNEDRERSQSNKHEKSGKSKSSKHTNIDKLMGKYVDAVAHCKEAYVAIEKYQGTADLDKLSSKCVKSDQNTTAENLDKPSSKTTARKHNLPGDIVHEKKKAPLIHAIALLEEDTMDCIDYEDDMVLDNMSSAVSGFTQPHADSEQGSGCESEPGDSRDCDRPQDGIGIDTCERSQDNGGGSSTEDGELSSDSESIHEINNSIVNDTGGKSKVGAERFSPRSTKTARSARITPVKYPERNMLDSDERKMPYRKAIVFGELKRQSSRYVSDSDSCSDLNVTPNRCRERRDLSDSKIRMRDLRTSNGRRSRGHLSPRGRDCRRSRRSLSPSPPGKHRRRSRSPVVHRHCSRRSRSRSPRRSRDKGGRNVLQQRTDKSDIELPRHQRNYRKRSHERSPRGKNRQSDRRHGKTIHKDHRKDSPDICNDSDCDCKARALHRRKEAASRKTCDKSDEFVSETDRRKRRHNSSSSDEDRCHRPKHKNISTSKTSLDKRCDSNDKLVEKNIMRKRRRHSSEERHRSRSLERKRVRRRSRSLSENSDDCDIYNQTKCVISQPGSSEKENM